MSTRTDRLVSPSPTVAPRPGTWPERSRQIQETMTGGALGGGMLLAGFGATLGYLFERRASR